MINTLGRTAADACQHDNLRVVQTRRGEQIIASPQIIKKQLLIVWTWSGYLILIMHIMAHY